MEKYYFIAYEYTQMGSPGPITGNAVISETPADVWARTMDERGRGIAGHLGDSVLITCAVEIPKPAYETARKQNPTLERSIRLAEQDRPIKH